MCTMPHLFTYNKTVATHPYDQMKKKMQDSITAVDLPGHLPLQFVKSDPIPPAPTPSQFAVDWLPDFAGLSWVAYGASTLLVISHFPSPLSSEEALIGPIFRQVVEIAADESAAVSVVGWSPATPSVGELAAASGNCVCVFSHDSERAEGMWLKLLLLRSVWLLGNCERMEEKWMWRLVRWLYMT